MSILEGRVSEGIAFYTNCDLAVGRPSCAAAQEHVETRIWNFHFFVSFFCQIAARAYFGSCNRLKN